MRTGICLLLLASEHDPLARESIPLVARSGYDYAEVSLARIYDLSAGELEDYKKLFVDNGLKVEAFNNAIPVGFSVIGDDALGKAQAAYIQRSIELASFFGASVITTSGPNAKRVPAGFDWQNVGYARYIDFLRSFAAECAKNDISIALEPICRAERGYVNSVAQAVAIIKEVERENLSLLVDIFHSSLEGEDFSRLELYVQSGLLKHLHVAALPERRIPLLKDTEALANILYPLAKAGFDGRVSIEANTADWRSAVPQGAEAVKRACRRNIYKTASSSV